MDTYNIPQNMGEVIYINVIMAHIYKLLITYSIYLVVTVLPVGLMQFDLDMNGCLYTIHTWSTVNGNKSTGNDSSTH